MESLSEVFNLLSKERRRYALYYLERADSPVLVDELATQINKWESERSASAVPDGEYDRIILTLRHTHLPKAAEAEYIEFDPDSDLVEISGSPPEFKAILHVAEAIDQPGGDDITDLI